MVQCVNARGPLLSEGAALVATAVAVAGARWQVVQVLQRDIWQDLVRPLPASGIGLALENETGVGILKT